MCYVIELCCCTVSLCYVAVFVVSVLCTVCHCVLLCQCVMSPNHVRYHYVVVLSHCTMSPFFNAVSLFFNVLCTVSLYYVSETGCHYVVLCRAFSVSVLCTVCQCTMSARLDIIMSYYVALVQSVCYALYVSVLCQRDRISLCPWAVSLFFRHYVIHSLLQWQFFFFRHSIKTNRYYFRFIFLSAINPSSSTDRIPPSVAAKYSS